MLTHTIPVASFKPLESFYWESSGDWVVVTVSLKGIGAAKDAAVTCDFTGNSFDLRVANFGGAHYRVKRSRGREGERERGRAKAAVAKALTHFVALSVVLNQMVQRPLAKYINDKGSIFKVKKNKIVVKLRKKVRGAAAVACCRLEGWCDLGLTQLFAVQDTLDYWTDLLAKGKSGTEKPMGASDDPSKGMYCHTLTLTVLWACYQPLCSLCVCLCVLVCVYAATCLWPGIMDMMKKLYDEGDDTMKKVLTQVPVGSRNSVVYCPAFHTLFCCCGATRRLQRHGPRAALEVGSQHPSFSFLFYAAAGCTASIKQDKQK